MEISSTLTGAWTTADPGTAAGQAHITTTPGWVKYTFPAGTRSFVRLKVTPPLIWVIGPIVLTAAH